MTALSNRPVGLRRIEPVAQDWASLAFAGGRFDTGRRGFTPSVEGTIRTPDHLILVTLEGGAEHVEVSTECGHRYVGIDRPGAVSFVPAHCERRLRMRGVAARWASIAWAPDARSDAIGPFTNTDDPFLLGLASEFLRQHRSGTLEAIYCETMVQALARYMRGRYGPRPAQSRHHGLPAWRLRRVEDFIEAHLSETVRIADLAAVAGVSAGHFHRAFRQATRQTPAAFLRERRVQRAVAILRAEPVGVTEVALRVGFQSPSRLASHVRRATGLNPSRLRG